MKTQANPPPLRPELPPTTRRIEKLPIDERGYPIPWFVSYIDGKPDFRIADGAKWVKAVQEKICWVCGQPLGVHKTFCIGPMCAVTRTTTEPAIHLDCGVWSVRACPFMLRPTMKRREGGNVEDPEVENSGVLIERNPGVMCLWQTRDFKLFKDQNGKPLIEVGYPEIVTWWREGRAATRAEILESIESGYPKLTELCDSAEDLEALAGQRRFVETSLLPS